MHTVLSAESSFSLLLILLGVIVHFSPEGNFLTALAGVLDLVSHIKQTACRNKYFRNPFRL